LGGALGLGLAAFIFHGGDVGREFDDLEHLAIEVDQRVVGSLNPYLLAAAPQPAEFVGDELATIQPVPQLAIFAALGILRIGEHAVMAPDNFGRAIAHRRQEVLIGAQDIAVEIELDDRLRTAYGRDLGLELIVLVLGCSDVGRKLDDLVGLSALVADGIVAGLNPDLLATLGDALVFAGVKIS